MCLEVALGNETFVTTFERARERPVAGVGTHVRLEVSSFAELLHAVAERAEKQLVDGTLAPQDFDVELVHRQQVEVRCPFLADCLDFL